MRAPGIGILLSQYGVINESSLCRSMRTSEIDFPVAVRRFLRKAGYDELYPPQADSVSAGLLEGTTMLVTAPTASGKTLIALLAILGCLLRDAGKAVYLSPLRALASEKYEEFKAVEKIPINGAKPRVEISTSDYEVRRADFERADIIVMTNERMDSIMRQRPAWLRRIGLVISDEIHLLGDETRGPAREVALSHTKSMEPTPQILGLSATVSNANEIAAWLDAELVTSKWRPVPLRKGIYDGGTVVMKDGSVREIETSVRGAAVDLSLECIADGGQSLVFANTRANAASLATKASTAVERITGQKNTARLEAAAKKILRENENTDTVKKLAGLIRHGVAFHHAGLSHGCRTIVESEFREGAIRFISTTPTLAAGVNLPARRVVIPAITRYDMATGRMKLISTLEYKQMSGRAGRPQYDDYGEAIIVAGNVGVEAAREFIELDPDPIVSCMLDAQAMRVHTLGLLAMSPSMQEPEIVDFFMNTLAGTQKPGRNMRHEVKAALRFLTREEFATLAKSEKYASTAFGRLVSRLYLDPDTAMRFRALTRLAAPKRDHTLGLLCEITACNEFYPQFAPRKCDEAVAMEILEDHSEELLTQMHSKDFDRAPLALFEWADERSESAISDRLGVEPGDIRRMVERAAWLSYCIATIARHVGKNALAREANTLQYRISYGVRAELVDLVRLRGIGRMRARRLYRAGFKDREALSHAPLEEIARIGTINKTIAVSIKSQLRTRGPRP